MDYNREFCQRQLRTALHPSCHDGSKENEDFFFQLEFKLEDIGKGSDSLRDVLEFLRDNKGKGNPFKIHRIDKSYVGRACKENRSFIFPAQIFIDENDQTGTDKIDNLINEALSYYQDNRYYIFTLIKL